MKSFILFTLLFCACQPAITKPADTITKTITISNSVLPVFEDKDKPDCLKTVEYKVVKETQPMTPDMVFFCTTFDIKDQLKCLKWEKAYKAMICVGNDCKAWTQGEASQPFGNVRD